MKRIYFITALVCFLFPFIGPQFIEVKLEK